MTLGDTAEGIISVSHLSNIEKCRKSASLETLMFLCDKLSIDDKQVIIDSLHESDYFNKLHEIANLLFIQEVEKAHQELICFIKQVNIEYQSVPLELSYYCLLAICMYKQQEAKQAKLIEKQFLNGLTKLPITSIPFSLQPFYIQFKIQTNFISGKFEDCMTWGELGLTKAFNERYQAGLLVSMSICGICLNNYEQSIHYLELLKQLLDKHTYVYHKSAYYYLNGYVHYEISLYKKAESLLKDGKEYCSYHKDETRHYRMLIDCKLIEVLKKEGNIDEFREAVITLYENVILLKDNFKQNDFVLINELLLWNLELNDYEKVHTLKTLLEPMANIYQQHAYTLKYADCMYAKHCGDITTFELLIDELSKEIRNSDDPLLIQQVKSTASKYYAEQSKYKAAYNIVQLDE